MCSTHRLILAYGLPYRAASHIEVGHMERVPHGRAGGVGPRAEALALVIRDVGDTGFEARVMEMQVKLMLCAAAEESSEIWSEGETRRNWGRHFQSGAWARLSLVVQIYACDGLENWNSIH